MGASRVAVCRRRVICSWLKLIPLVTTSSRPAPPCNSLLSIHVHTCTAAWHCYCAVVVYTLRDEMRSAFLVAVFGNDTCTSIEFSRPWFDEPSVFGGVGGTYWVDCCKSRCAREENGQVSQSSDGITVAFKEFWRKCSTVHTSKYTINRAVTRIHERLRASRSYTFPRACAHVCPLAPPRSAVPHIAACGARRGGC